METNGFSFQIRDHLQLLCNERRITLLHQGEKLHQLLDMINYSSMGSMNDAEDYLLASDRLIDSYLMRNISFSEFPMRDCIFQMWRMQFIKIKHNIFFKKKVSRNLHRRIEDMIAIVGNHGHDNEVIKNYIKSARLWYRETGNMYHSCLNVFDPPNTDNLDVFKSYCIWCKRRIKDEGKLVTHKKKCKKFQKFRKQKKWFIQLEWLQKWHIICIYVFQKYYWY